MGGTYTHVHDDEHDVEDESHEPPLEGAGIEVPALVPYEVFLLLHILVRLPDHDGDLGDAQEHDDEHVPEHVDDGEDPGDEPARAPVRVFTHPCGHARVALVRVHLPVRGHDDVQVQKHHRGI